MGDIPFNAFFNLIFKEYEPFFFLVKHYQSIGDTVSLYALVVIITLDLTLAIPFQPFLYYLGKVTTNWFLLPIFFITILTLCFYESARQLVQ